MPTTTAHKTTIARSDLSPAIAQDFGDVLDTRRAGLQLANAVSLAAEVHLYQPRKVSGTSYLSHPMLASGMVIKTGGTVRAATIALLHDVVEEGGESAFAQLHSRFSASIRTAVAQMTPHAAEAKLPWVDRKECSLERIRSACDTDVAMAFAADKAATLYELQADMQLMGAFNVLSKLRHDCEALQWYYQSCMNALAGKTTFSMEALLRTHVDWLRREISDWQTVIATHL